LASNQRYGAALVSGAVHLVSLTGNLRYEHFLLIKDEQPVRIIPQNTSSYAVKQMAMARDFIVLATSHGSIQIYHVGTGGLVYDYRHPKTITSIYPDGLGTRVILIDDANEATIIVPTEDAALPVLDLPRMRFNSV
jgi:hypothetical protein